MIWVILGGGVVVVFMLIGLIWWADHLPQNHNDP